MEIEGKIIGKYESREWVQLMPIELFTILNWQSPYMPLKRMSYEIDAEDKKYALVTTEDCDLPEEAKVRIRIAGKLLKRISLLYGDKEFPVISLSSS